MMIGIDFVKMEQFDEEVNYLLDVIKRKNKLIKLLENERYLAKDIMLARLLMPSTSKIINLDFLAKIESLEDRLIIVKEKINYLNGG